METAPVMRPSQWQGIEYRPSDLVRRRARFAALAIGAGGIFLAALSVQILLLRFPFMPNYSYGRTALVVFTALAFSVAGVAMFSALWVYRLAESALVVAEEGILYRDHLGICWTAWDNVRRYEKSGIPLLSWDSLSLYRPPFAVYAPLYGWLLALAQPHWVRREAPFIPLNPLAPFWCDRGLLQALRARAPWVFSEET